MEYILEQANHDQPRLKFYFNINNNSNNPNKHIYQIVDIGGYEDVFYFVNENGDETDNDDNNCYATFNPIIPISLKPFKM